MLDGRKEIGKERHTREGKVAEKLNLQTRLYMQEAIVTVLCPGFRSSPPVPSCGSRPAHLEGLAIREPTLV